MKFAIRIMTKKILWRDMFGMTTALQKIIIHENGWAGLIEIKNSHRQYWRPSAMIGAQLIPHCRTKSIF